MNGQKHGDSIANAGLVHLDQLRNVEHLNHHVSLLWRLDYEHSQEAISD
jgi:hypothetical protein